MLFIGLALPLVLSACVPGLVAPPASGPEAVYTAAHATIVAGATLSAGQTAVAQLTQQANPAQPTPEQPGATQLPATALLTSTPWPTVTPPPPAATATTVWPTPVPPTAVPPTAVPLPCDQAEFVKDLSVPDGSVLQPGAAFTKSWRLRNAGSCTWGGGYALVFVSGDYLYTLKSLPLPAVVRPGETVDLAVNLIAPLRAGNYRSNWMLSNAYGQAFGLGANASKPFWADIRVATVENQNGYDFTANMCAASWRSGERSLRCPGEANDDAGAVLRLGSPVLETGKHENEPALFTHPDYEAGGWIVGVYPAYRVQSGDRFRADIGCLADSKGCDVTFALQYQIQGQAVKSLGAWRESYDGKITRLDLDLSFLAGQTVQFTLSVSNHGKPARANAFWLVPAIQRGGSPAPTPAPGEDPAVKAARRAVGKALGIDPHSLLLHSVISVQWTDTCLGVYSPNRICEWKDIPGYRIILTLNNRQFEVHTDLDGSLVFWFEL